MKSLSCARCNLCGIQFNARRIIFAMLGITATTIKPPNLLPKLVTELDNLVVLSAFVEHHVLVFLHVF